jgi:hypothetical protein
MRPARRIKQAEAVACDLQKHLKSSTLSQLLQCPPSASLTADQEAHLYECCRLLGQLEEPLLEKEPALQLRLLDAILQKQALCGAVTLIAWMQQQPEQLLPLRSSALQLPGIAALREGGGMGAVSWAAGVNVLIYAVEIASRLDFSSAAARQTAAGITQQLDQSGNLIHKSCSSLVAQ